MNRQLYGVGSLVGREKFGLGSKLKKFVRKVIPNEVADVAVKAAPFVAPFNPALAAGMSGLGKFDQTGSISRGVKSGLLTYGLGQGARFLGGAELQGSPFQGKLFTSPIGTERTGLGTFLEKRKAAEVGQQIADKGMISQADTLVGQPVAGADPGTYVKVGDIAATSIEKTAPTIMESAKKLTSLDTFSEGLTELGGKGLKAVFTKPVPGSPGETQIDKLAIGATIAGGATYLDAKRLAKEADLVDDADEYTEEMYEADKARYQDYYKDIITPAAFGLKKGGRVMYQSGSTPFGVPSITLDEKDDQLDIEALKETLRKYPEKTDEITDFEVGIFKAGPATDQGPYPMDDMTQEEKEAEMLKELLRERKADGGIMRTNFAMGSDDPSDPKFSPQGGKGILEMDPLKSDFDEIKGGGGIGGLLSPFTRAEKSFLFKTLAKQGGSDRTFTMPQLYRIFKNPGKFKKDEQALKAFLKVKGFKNGGRIGFAEGSDDMKINPDNYFDPRNLNTEDLILLIRNNKGTPEIFKELMLRDVEGIESLMLDEIGGKKLDKPQEVFQVNEEQLKDYRINKRSPIESFLYDLRENNPDVYGEYKEPRQFMPIAAPSNYAQGGRAELAMGSEVPVRQNEGGIKELDYRETGGFVPVGIKEKADDVPAMLSKNEFVMTADAVRGIGNGDVETGAQKLYNLMKQAEKRNLV